MVDSEPCTIRIQGERITSVERGPAPPSQGPEAEELERVLDARGLHAFPSLKNGHTHAGMSLFRGYGDDMPLMEWLETRIWPAERHLTEEDVYRGTRLSILEMIRGGTTFFNDMYWHRPGTVRAVEEMGVRALVGVTLISLGDAAMLARQKVEVEALVKERASRSPAAKDGTGKGGGGAGAGGVADLALAPHAIYTVTPEMLEWVGAVAREADLPVHIHLSETEGEVEECLRVHGCRPGQLLARLGLVGPNLVAAHGQFLDDGELKQLGAAGATVVTNPTANLKLATGGIFPYRRARRAGVRVCLGTDGPASNNNLDLLEEMKVAALVQKHRERDATVLTAAEALAMATTSASDAFRLGTGRIEAGALADLILIDFSGPSTQPLHDPVSALVYAGSAANVDTTICRGRVLMHDRKVEVCDEDEVIQAACEAARAVLERSARA